ncbi:MAG: restriction endonuclease subunit S, partial [Desulfobulbaceae bacterium]|nr:restriction endonuclease subunit S [Desulfobulbaceae bacterium]
RPDTLIRFSPVLSRKDWILQSGDVLFMARGARNYSVILHEIPDLTVAAACFFIVRVSSEKVLPGYLCWYLNQAPCQHYLNRHSGRGVHMPVVRRTVMENIDIPLPPLETQKIIVNINALMQKEEELTGKLTEKRKTLLTATCLKAVRQAVTKR